MTEATTKGKVNLRYLDRLKEKVLIYDGAIDDKATTEQADVAAERNYVSQALEHVEAGQPVSTPTSRPYGCSVKYAH